MNQSRSRRHNSSWLKPLLVIAVATLFTAACKDSAVQGSSGGGGPSGGSPGGPPSGGMPSPGGGMPSPGGSSGSGSPSPSGDSSDGGASGGSSGGAGDVGAIPPPPGQGGGGGGIEGESGGGADGGGDVSGGGGIENPFGNADSSDSDNDSECGDTGALPGGIGGMGREGECLSSESPSASESESESSSSAADSGGGGGGGGSSGGATTGTGGAGSVGEFPAESSAERADRLGRELDESIGGFDETLGAEQREIAAAGRVIEGYDIAGEEGQGSGGLISLGGQSASTEGQFGSVGGGRTPISEPLAGLTQQDIEELTPDDIPTMVDDDIIARQLREAAIVEKNPDLRDRLWDEYRKYKGISVSD